MDTYLRCFQTFPIFLLCGEKGLHFVAFHVIQNRLELALNILKIIINVIVCHKGLTGMFVMSFGYSCMTRTSMDVSS